MIASKIIEIGAMVPELAAEKIIILFGPAATEELKEVCVIHQFEQHPDNVLAVGHTLHLAGYDYTITQVGQQANKNFDELGHVSIYFATNNSELLPGAIAVEPALVPQLQPGDTIQVRIRK